MRPVLLALAAMALAFPAAAQTVPPTVVTGHCDVAADSRIGGAIRILGKAAPGDANPQTVWLPTATGGSIGLFVIYTGNNLTRLDEPDGVYIRFKPQADRSTQGVALVVKTRGGRSWRFEGAAVQSGPNDSHVTFGLAWPYGRGLLNAIAGNQNLDMSVEQEGRVVATESFALANVAARDILLAQLHTRFLATDGAHCAPEG